MSSFITPVRSNPEQIRYLARTALAIANVLEAIDVLPVKGQHTALALSATLADDLAKELAFIVGGAA